MATAQPGLWKRHEIFETNSIVLLIGALLVVAAMYVVLNFLIDLLYAVLDPRIADRSRA